LIATGLASRSLDVPGVAMSSSMVLDAQSHMMVLNLLCTALAVQAGLAIVASHGLFYISEDSDTIELVEVLQDSGQEVPPALKMLGDS